MKTIYFFKKLVFIVMLSGISLQAQTKKSVEGNVDNFANEVVWNAGVKYFLSRNFSLMASYDNRFGGGGGLSVRF